MAKRKRTHRANISSIQLYEAAKSFNEYVKTWPWIKGRYEWRRNKSLKNN